jgi:predicted amidohydrolase YtcJ
MKHLIEKLQQGARKRRVGEWILGFGYDETTLKEGRHPQRTDLDQISTTNPICIMHVSRHFCVLNSSALNALDISKKMEPPVGGVIHLDKSGEPNGILQDANALVDSVQSSFDETQWEAAIKRDSAAYLSVGVTTTVIGGWSRKIEKTCTLDQKWEPKNSSHFDANTKCRL